MDFIAKLFDSNKRDLARMQRTVVQINALEQRCQGLPEAAFRDRIEAIRQEVQALVAEYGLEHAKIETVMREHLPEVFALCREASVRTLGLRNFDVQMVASIALHEGRIAEQKTGEGKTLSAVPALVLNSLTGKGSHLITVNDYLARHGAEWMGPIYRLLGVNVNVLQHGTPPSGRRKIYASDIVYGTNNEFGFDYLRDNMVIRAEEMVQGALGYGIVDECDSILVDEARTPLIISGSSNEDTSLYKRVDSVMRRLSGKDVTGEDKPKDIIETLRAKKNVDDSHKTWDYEFDRKGSSVSLTTRGVEKLERELNDMLQDDVDDEGGGRNLYAYVNTEIAHFVQQSLRAHALYRRDTDYVVKDGQVIIVDEFTGRLMFGRRYGEGLHQAIEAREGLNVAPESQTLATITIQNFFRIYHKLAGMTGTAKTEEEEFKKIYGMDVVVVPTNMPVARKDHADVVYKTEKSKYEAIAENVKECHAKGQPVLVGTVSIEKSERLEQIFVRHGIPCQVLNAKQHEREAFIVAQAGRPGMVTIATNMAGRGTDIVLGGNSEFAAREHLRGLGLDPEENDEKFRELVNQLKPEYDAAHEAVKAAGGFYVIGSERHESRRIDNQLRGRSGRQGDPGASRFFLSLEDDLMKMYGGERVQQLMEFLKIEDDVPIESGMLSKSIENAQKKVEGHHFDIRKHLLQYDDVNNKQRQVIYDERRRILEGSNLRDQIMEFITTAVQRVVEGATLRQGRATEVDYEHLVSEAKASFPLPGLTEELLSGKRPEEITELLSAQVQAIYEQKERQIGRVVLRRMQPEITDEELAEQELAAGEPHMRELERVFTLRGIDENWIDHLNMLDHLRSGVSLRGYGQQDPVVIYAQEAFDAFEEMKERIQADVIRKLFMVQVREEPKVERTNVYNVRAQGRLMPGQTDERGKRLSTKRTGAKIGRNMKCYCGSGKKYKKCHGVSEENPPDNWEELYEKAYGEAPLVEAE
jgi:preprotein translocase subunit SecA